jgi:hypothetical protein
LTVQLIGCTTCGRTVYARGAARIVEAARTLEGKELVTEYLAKVSLAREADIAMVLEEYARLGQLRVPLQKNQLRGRLWEFKVGDTRLPFYETRDAGHLLMVARITHGFTKRSQRTPMGQINRGIWVIGQDEQWVWPEDERAAIGPGEQAAIGPGEQAAIGPGEQEEA